MKRFPHIWKFNWRLIALHVAVMFLLVLSAEQLARLTAIQLLQLVEKYGKNLNKHLKEIPDFLDQMTRYYEWQVYLPLIALILSFILSIIISVRNKFSFLNAIIALIIVFFGFRYGIFFSYFTRSIFYFPGRLIARSSLLMSFILNGAYLFALSFILLYSPFIKRRWVFRQPEKIDRELLDEN